MGSLSWQQCRFSCLGLDQSQHTVALNTPYEDKQCLASRTNTHTHTPIKWKARGEAAGSRHIAYSVLLQIERAQVRVGRHLKQPVLIVAWMGELPGTPAGRRMEFHEDR